MIGAYGAAAYNDGHMLKIFQAPLALGSFSNGVDQGPDVLLREGLLTALAHNGIEAEVHEPIEVRGELTDKGKLRNFDAVVNFNKELLSQIIESTNKGDVALTLGGDHSIGMGSMLATKQRCGDACIVYIDAHPDCSNPEETLTGNLHGMPLSTALGDALHAEFGGPHYNYDEVIILGAKDMDDHEVRYMQVKGIRYITMDEITEQGIAHAFATAQQLVGEKPVHVTLDIDSIDVSEAPGTGIINQGGLSYREVSYLCRKLSELNIVAVDVVEVNPARDEEGKTVQLGIELAVSLLGGEWSRYMRYLESH
jgi:arginase